MEDGRIANLADGTCMSLADGDTYSALRCRSCVCIALRLHSCSTGGGMLIMGPCSASSESGDGRGVFAMTPNGQLKMPQLGNYCVTVSGKGVADTDIAQGADVTATSSNAQHPVEHIAGALMRLSAHS